MYDKRFNQDARDACKLGGGRTVSAKCSHVRYDDLTMNSTNKVSCSRCIFYTRVTPCSRMQTPVGHQVYISSHSSH